MSEYIELDRIRPHMPSVEQSVQVQARHLQKCLTALEKIRAIVGIDSAPGLLAHAAIQNAPWSVGGTED